MLTVTAQMTQGSDVVKLTMQENGQSTVKNVKTEAYVDFLKGFSSSNKDTGYIPSSLVREVTTSEGTKRIYHFKELAAEIRLQRLMSHGRLSLKADNPSGFTYDTSEDIITLKDFKLKDVGGIICNNNSEGFTAYKYAAGFIQVPITGILNDNVKFRYCVFNNHFDSARICWPRGMDIDPVLNNKDPFIQSTFITQYFNSIFNTDLHHHLKADNKETIDAIIAAGFKEFFDAHFTCSTTDAISLLKDALTRQREYSETYMMKYIILYFIFKTGCVRLESLLSDGSGIVVRTLGNFQ